MGTSDILHEIQRIKSIADIGLLYSTNEYDRERYEELLQISYQLLNKVTSHSVEDIKLNLPLSKDYPTAKVDIRGMVLSPDKKILLVKEIADGQWSLPGGWADVGYSPSETIIKEIKEETGLDVNVQQLLAVFDKRKHPHPPQAEYVYKIVFYCEAISSEVNKGFDVLDVQFFSINELPPLSENRIIKSQVQLAYDKIMKGDKETYFD